MSTSQLSRDYDSPRTNGVHSEHIAGLARKEISKELLGTLPAKFYHSTEVYDLERRAIFSKRWILVSHKARYRNVGDYVQYEMAGFSFVVVKNKDYAIVGFHNICRHRAFPIVRKAYGNARIFSCQYHGWSYDLNGTLTKAPRFTSESVPSFDSAGIRLFPLHVHVDRNGFVYVNLDSSKQPEISWQEQYSYLDQQGVLSSAKIDWDAVEYDFTWEENGLFNWKLMQDNFNECYHCLTAHPDVAKTTALDTYYVEPGAEGCYIAHFSEPKVSLSSVFDETRFIGRSATHVFPVGHFSPNPGTGFMHLMRTVPTGPNSVRQEYDVYKLNTPLSTPEAHERMVKFYKKVTAEDIALCNAVQTNLERGIYTAGPLHPFHEEGVAAFQDMLKAALTSHIEEEKKAHREIWPAKPKDCFADLGNDALSINIHACQTSNLEW